jgi:site-specific DNA recombinase
MKNPTAIYIRVSTEEQAKEGISIPAQKDRLAAFCKAKDFDIFDFYIDEGFSAGSLKRPQLKRLLDDARTKKFSNIVVYKIDRFSRNLKDLITLLDEFKGLKVNFISASEPIDTTSAIGNAFMQIIGVFAELERGMVTERVKLAFDKKLSMKEYLSRPPLGYRVEGKTLVIDEEKAKLIREIFADRLAGVNFRETCSRLGIPKSTYYYIIGNSAYVGILRYKNRIFKAEFEPIIDLPTFYKASRRNARFLEAITGE